ncbi:MAG: hypothetical protein K2K98_09960 [Muribaculaceae bacterium]|nr:hypothetical protein [Muribaculaceae bacterium]
MYRIVISMLFVFAIITANAHSTDNRDEKCSLVQRVDSLEHELSYLKLRYDLSTLKSDLEIFSNDVYTKSLAVKLDLYGQNFDKQLGDAYKRFYEACLERQDSFSELVDATNTSLISKAATYPYTELELNGLLLYYKCINDAYRSLESSMDLLKQTIDAYWKFI